MTSGPHRFWSSLKWTSTVWLPLPDDIEALKELLANRDALIAKLLAEIARLKRWQFGRSSERFDATLAQLQLALDDLQSATQTSVMARPTRPAMMLARIESAPRVGDTLRSSSMLTGVCSGFSRTLARPRASFSVK